MFSFVAEELYKICIMVVRRRTELNVSRWITLASSESINFECKTAGGICWKNNLPTYGIHFEVPEK